MASVTLRINGSSDEVGGFTNEKHLLLVRTEDGAWPSLPLWDPLSYIIDGTPHYVISSRPLCRTIMNCGLPSVSSPWS